ncbi:RNA-binding ribosome biosynthesis protein MRD1 ASCRUDRAFT_47449 [Ascoidea rubescens DSM 1968]|uniref:Multiple RNA-binding domain-containing protein 1 n=1 Tax=Ascoidea rubescens DSM 1968 TaxID=1344418 RepID=A0A1D2VFG4_9ASCO|nr:hypothetical protein ASCRUDRAFT_47449 [Ascoidea rubescens DSM 1968]ODV60322.1 hypothetical protein ASCRUDRAFT_47449 [Ascoidea rubescens DSM 1968]
MSRVIIKGLPIYLDEEQLKKKLGRINNNDTITQDITDLKIVRNAKTGESRKFGFIGFKTYESAEKIIKYFDNSFIDTSRVNLQFAKSFADPSVPKSFRQRQREINKRKQIEEQREKAKEIKKRRLNVREEIDEKINKNKVLKEYLDTVNSTVKIVDGKGNPSVQDLEDALNKKDNEIKNDKNEDGITRDEENESDEEYEDFRPKSQEEKNEESDNNGNENEDNEREEKMISLSEMAKDSTVSDLDWLKQHRIRMLENSKENKNNDQNQEESDFGNEVKNSNKDTKKKFTEQEKTEELILETGRLFIRNILYTATEEDFRELFGPYGILDEVHIAVDTRTHKSKGFVYIQFQNPKDALFAYKELDKQIFQGRLLHILPSKAKKSHRLDEFDIKNLPLKKQKELKKKEMASKSQFTWNSLFMSNDAVIESVASKLRLKKSDLIDPESSSSGVKQALAEVDVIGDVRKYFESKGIDLTSFEKKQEKDDKVILVKNFPFGTTSQEIADLFIPFGELKRLLFPPSGTIAIVEYIDIPSGRAAFTKLAYKRFKNSVIYLEKGPKDLFKREPTEGERHNSKPKEAANDKSDEDKDVKKAKISASDILLEATEENEPDAHQGTTASVFIKNLNFKTTTKDLMVMFKTLPGFLVVQVKESKPGVSMGFGFAEFKTMEDANNFISTFNGKSILEHKIELKISNRVNDANAKIKPAGKKNEKLIVKNLPFEATRKDVFDLFNPFGDLRSVRVPRKFNNQTKGYAFVEFVLSKEAEHAMQSLTGVHLLGRRLVIEYSNE